MRIDLIALDLDGTLLDPEEQVSAANRAAIKPRSKRVSASSW